MTTVEPVMLTVAEAAQALRIGRTRTYDLIRLGKLESVKVFGSRRIPVDALHAFVKALRKENQQ